MNITRFKSMVVLLCLFIGAQRIDAQCNITLSADVTDIACFGDAGAIDLTVSGGQAPYSYNWSNGQTDEDIDGLGLGLYIVTVTDNLGCIANLARTINGPIWALSLVLNDEGALSCSNLSDEVVPDISGGVEPYTFLWSTGSTNSAISATVAGTYTVTITDDHGCTISAAKAIGKSPGLPIADAGPDQIFISCATAPNMIGGPNTSIGPNFIYHWENFVGGIDPGVDITQPFIEATNFGTHILTVTNIVEGCSASDLITVLVDASFPSVLIQNPPHLTCLVHQVTLNATGSSTGGQYTYLWTSTNGHIVSGANTLTPVVDAPGNYILAITNTQVGCTKRGEAVVIADQGTLIANAGADTGIPCGGTQVTLDGSGSSSGVQYVYQWSTANGNIVAGSSTLSPITDQPGTYTLIVTDTQTGCTRTDAVKVFPGPAIPQTDFFLLDVSCTGQLGGASVTMSQGTAPYLYLWSNGSTQSSIVNIVQGTYTITVTDNTGCNYYAEVEIKDTSTLTLSAQTTVPSCNPGNDGAIDLTATSVFGPFEYAWSTGETTQDLSSLGAGTYTVTVTYAIGSCTETLSVSLSTSSMTLGTVVTDANTCLGTNGHIDLTVSGGTAPYLYLWSDGETAQDASPISLGTFTVTVVDANGCSATTSATIQQTTGIIPTTVVTNVSCIGNNGSINLSVSGGASPYVYLWTTGATTQDINNIPVGTYTVTITDAGNCTQTATAIVGQAAPSTNLSTTIVDASCTGACTGSIDLMVTGGVTPYQYAWSPGNTTQDIFNLCPATYTVTVTEANGCTKTITSVIGIQASGIVLTVVPTDAACNICNGAVDLTVTGGQAPYAYFWSNGEMNQDMVNLCANSFIVTVMDALGCSKTASVTVGQIPVFSFTGAVTASNSCITSNGGIDITMAPAGAYTFLWSNGATTQNLTGLAAGNYSLTVTDGVGCTDVDTYTVPDLSNAPVLSTSVTDASCNGNDGAIDLTVISGASPYTYLWPTGDTNEDVTNLAAGNYIPTVTDALGCTATTSATVGQQAVLTLSAVVNASTNCIGGNGSIDLSVAPTGSYTYTWSDGETTEDVNNLAPGTYTVTVSDGIACSSVDTYNVPDLLDLPGVSAIPTPSTCDLANGSINVSVSGGVAPYNYLWSNGVITQDLSNITANFYVLTVTGANGCTSTINVDVTNNNLSISISGTVAPNTICNGQNGSIDLGVTPGGLTYLWSNGATTQDLIVLPAGTYTVTVSAGGTCTETASFIVPDNTNHPNFTILSLSNNCNSETITGPNLPNFTYQWLGPNSFTSTSVAITANASGLYSLTVTDGNGCTATDDYSVNLVGGGTCGALKGSVFYDKDESCSLDPGETGLAGWIVRAEGANDTLYGVTDAQGQYLVGVPVGTYAVKVFVPNGLWTVCPVGVLATVGMSGDTVSGGDFPVKASYICPALTVSIGTYQLRRCFSGNYYQVEYCNQGTQKAQDAFVTVALDPFLSPVSSSIPYTDLGTNLLRFEVGDLDIGECGSFKLQVYLNCNAQLGQTHCTQASIFPDTLCVPPSANWSGASLSVQSVCETDSLRFTLRNDGKGTMNNSANYIVVEDGIMFRTGQLAPLMENEFMDITVPANGSTWRVEVDQEAFHPYPSPVGLSVEGCTTASSFSTGFVNQFPTPDESPTLDFDCTANIGSFDPNDKYGYPVGYGADHYVRPGTDIEYLVRFQNTGTDTAFTVKIVDTLSAWLDPVTIRFGASSHPYRYDLDGEGVVHFIFDNILLPDSNTNEAASQGFAKFIIKPRADAPLETVIENTAAIYFDFNDPVFTNTTFHRLGVNFITVGLWQPFVPEAQVIAVPNPFSEETTLEVKGLRRNDALHLQVFDLQGNMVRQMESEHTYFHLKKGDWQAGVYLFKITQNGRLVGSGKLIAE